MSLSTLGRFHTFDLARQLESRALLGDVFSAFPRSKLRREGLPDERLHTFPLIHAPYAALARIGMPQKSALVKSWEYYDRKTFGAFVAKTMPAGHDLVALSSSGLEAGTLVKATGGIYVCDRGSTHIEHQEAVLQRVYRAAGQPWHGIHPGIIDRELREYEIAQAITVPSMQAKETFVANGVDAAKVHVIPYGVDLSKFTPTGSMPEPGYHFLFVGQVTPRKGILALTQAYRRLRSPAKSLTIVGPYSKESLGPLGLRGLENLTMTGALPQSRLPEFFSKSTALVLPSVEEGLALVVAQALASGCPVIATVATGASELITSGTEGILLDNQNPDSLFEAMITLGNGDEQRRMSAAAVARAQTIGGWNDYGENYARLLRELSSS